MQPALTRSPGLFSGVSIWRRQSGTSRAAVDDIAATLLEQGSPGAQIVVAVLLPYDGEPVLPWSGPAGRFPSTQSELLVQVAADTREEMLFALRRPHTLFAATLACDEEIIGGRIGRGREPFGFIDGVTAPTEEQVRRIAEVRHGPLAGGSWILYVRFQQNLSDFAALSVRAQEGVFGITRDAEPIPSPPPWAHVPLTKQYAEHGHHVFIRRGFPFRQEQEEGIAFVAITSSLDHYRRALDVMLGVGGPSDRVLRYATPVGGGIYFAAPDAAWLRARARHEKAS